MRVISFNANGIRAAARHGFFSWFAKQNADIVCLQEIKAVPQQLDELLFHPKGYKCIYHSAKRKGYSGVGLYLRKPPLQIINSFGIAKFDEEGRYIRAEYEQFDVVSVYLPSGSSGECRQQEKFSFMDYFLLHLRAIRNQGKPCILCGDWNIAHKKIDLKNWRSNQKNSGFLPEERAWMDDILEKEGFVDALRVVYPEQELYTWWSYRGQARANNTGWRIDYQIISAELRDKIQNAGIFNEQIFSDHAPLIIDYSLEW